MKVFLDTNVLASAFVARGLCADLYRYLLAEHEVQTGEVNLVELKRTLRDKLLATAEQISAVEGQLRDHTIVPKPTTRSTIRIRDRDDEWVLASAFAGEADMLVTGDQDFLSIAGEIPQPVLTPREAWERLRSIGEGTV
ncbi:MAG: putative toxin-antitoxin system toxin component, PIN family [Gemmatimonadaceae bacterium]|nr:putative toxin-antitoxin system toxin component, PIN family [Gemmatimonadaceae bacterium]MBA3559484.1 putative toxin-antitoxin system toxin component, PIN family [Gemmatimonadaceae bacterium]